MSSLDDPVHDVLIEVGGVELDDVNDERQQVGEQAAAGAPRCRPRDPRGPRRRARRGRLHAAQVLQEEWPDLQTATVVPPALLNTGGSKEPQNINKDLASLTRYGYFCFI